MAGETAKTEAVCLRIVPWSRTSHIVTWLTPTGPLTTVVKGAVRPKSVFLGQYDLNYTCELVHYLRGSGDLKPLRECRPLDLRETLRADYRLLALAGRVREVAERLAPQGPEAAEWFALVTRTLDRLAVRDRRAPALLAELLAFEIGALRLAGLAPEIEAGNGAFSLRGERQIPVSAEVARAISSPLETRDPKILLDTARAIGVFYSFHLDLALDSRRNVLRLISTNEEGTGKQDG